MVQRHILVWYQSNVTASHLRWLIGYILLFSCPDPRFGLCLLCASLRVVWKQTNPTIFRKGFRRSKTSFRRRRPDYLTNSSTKPNDLASTLADPSINLVLCKRISGMLLTCSSSREWHLEVICDFNSASLSLDQTIVYYYMLIQE